MNDQEIEFKAKHDQRQIGLEENQICIREGIVLTIDPRSRYGFEFFCWRSPNEMTKEMDLFIEYAKGKKCLLDIGSATGIFSMVFMSINPKSEATAFEPAEEAWEILNINSVYSGISRCRYALSDRKGELRMRKEWDHYVLEGATENDTEVECITGDWFCYDIISPDILKIDTEGMEVKVLRGLSNTIKEFHPVIFLEVHPQRIKNEGESVLDLIDMLKQWNYKAIDTKTNEPISYEEIGLSKEDLRIILI